ncbi:MAG: MarC family protein, partial [Starkeya sp.]|nr:MarC family protein [Starkeya sp.]
MLDYMFSAIVTMAVVIDPIGLAPLFLAVTSDLTAAERRLVAFRSAAIALAILVTFGLVGAPLLAALGIT